MKSLIVLLAINSIVITAKSNDLPNISTGSWEQHQEGVAVAMLLKSWTDAGGHHKDALDVYIKNTSSEIKYFNRNGRDCGFHIFYLASGGQKIPLHNYDSESDVVQRTVTPIQITPGEIFSHAIELTSDELTQVKSSPVECEFVISDSSAQKAYTIATSPKMLTAAP